MAGWPRLLRALRAQPAFAAVVNLTLGLGIGVNTAVFSFAYGIPLRPLPYPEPERLVRLYTVAAKEGGRETGSSPLDIEDWVGESRSLEAAGAYTEFDADVRSDGPAQPVRLCQLNAGALRALGVRPLLGRLFDAAGLRVPEPHRRVVADGELVRDPGRRTPAQAAQPPLLSRGGPAAARHR